MDEFLEEFPRAAGHMEDVDEKIMQFEIKYCTPPNADDLRSIIAEVHADHEECECSPCLAA